jgi:hypothetical protein
MYPYENVGERTHLIETPVQSASEMGCVGSKYFCEIFLRNQLKLKKKQTPNSHINYVVFFKNILFNRCIRTHLLQ